MAIPILIEAGIPCMGDKDTTYLREDIRGLFDNLPAIWDETRFIDGYPGKYVVLARRHGDTWYLAAVNAGKEPLKLRLDLDMFAGKTVSQYKDDKKGEPQLVPLKVKENGKVQLEIFPQGGAVLINK